MRPSGVVNFNILFKMKSWQSVLAADVDAAINRIESAEDERRINLIDYEATLEHMLLSVGAPSRDGLTGMKHLITGASARLTLRGARDFRFNAGVSNFWQRRHGSQPYSPESPTTLGRKRAHEGGPRDP